MSKKKPTYLVSLIKDKSLKVYDGTELVTYINPYSYLLSRKKVGLMSEFDQIHVDGISLVWLLRLLGVKVTRNSFDMTSEAPRLFQYCIENNKSVYFIGAKAEEVKKSIEVIQSSFAELNICGYRDGYVKSEYDQALQEVLNANPDYVVVGMGTPLQEEFLVDLKKAGHEGGGYTCGGFLHQTAGRIQYYPNWIDKMNLRWMYRIYKEPYLFKRYFIQYPQAFFTIVFDRFRS